MTNTLAKWFLYCHDHGGLVSAKNIEFCEGELTGQDFPNCKIHPHATLEVYNEEQIYNKFGFTMFEDREHLK